MKRLLPPLLALALAAAAPTAGESGPCPSRGPVTVAFPFTPDPYNFNHEDPEAADLPPDRVYIHLASLPAAPEGAKARWEGATLLATGYERDPYTERLWALPDENVEVAGRTVSVGDGWGVGRSGATSRVRIEGFLLETHFWEDDETQHAELFGR